VPKEPFPMFLTFSYLAKRDCAASGAVPRGDVV
jgi:hypothetical protein